jgi:hypothetical protein
LKAGTTTIGATVSYSSGVATLTPGALLANTTT